VYEIAKLPNANRVLAEIFSAFVRGLSLVLLAAALSAKAIVAFLAPPEYGVAGELVPIVALAYLYLRLRRPLPGSGPGSEEDDESPCPSTWRLCSSTLR
jgi:hypothetical protein